jgi:metaxin
MMSQVAEDTEETHQSRRQPQKSSSGIFAVPAPIKQLFDKFPLHTYAVNELPQRAPQHRDAHVLYIFTTEEAALRGLPSHNPACLKWQVRDAVDAYGIPHS